MPNVMASAGTAGTAQAPSPGQAVVLTSAVIVPAKPTSRSPLTIAYEASNPGGNLLEPTFRWYVNGSVVQEGPSNTLAPGPFTKGGTVHAEVTLAGGSLSTPAVVIANGQPEITSVVVGPENAVAGTQLSAVPAVADPDGDAVTCSYQWRVNGTPAGGPGSEGTFSTAGLRKRDSVSALVTCTDGEAAGNTVASSTVVLQNQAPKILSEPPLEVSEGLYAYQVLAKDPDGDALTYRLERFPAGMAIDAASGLIRWALPRGVMFSGRHEFAVACTVSDGDGGSDAQEFTIVIYDVMVN